MPPLISLLLPIKNGLPHLTATLEAVRRQTYTNYELIVQDGGSTDGTLDYLSSLRGLPHLAIESRPDRGIGQAYNRTLSRSSGDLVCFISADEYLEDDALERGVEWFNQHPDAAIVNGSVRLTNSDDEVIQIFETPAFSLLGHLRCETVLPFAGLLSRERIGSDLFYDESLQTCPDYDFWIRVGSRVDASDFISMNEVFKTARADRASMSFRAESFEQFCRDKLYVLDRYLKSMPPGPEIEALRRSATAGIHLWAAESLYFIEGASPSFLSWCAKAARIQPLSPRLEALARRSDAFTIDAVAGDIRVPEGSQPEVPPEAGSVAARGVTLEQVSTRPHWTGATVEHGSIVSIRTPDGPWEFAAEIPLVFDPELDRHYWYWVRIELEVRAGQVGVGILVGCDIAQEQIISSAQGRTTLFIRVRSTHGTGIVFRNAGVKRHSLVDLFRLSIVEYPAAVPLPSHRSLNGVD